MISCHSIDDARNTNGKRLNRKQRTVNISSSSGQLNSFVYCTEIGLEFKTIALLTSETGMRHMILFNLINAPLAFDQLHRCFFRESSISHECCRPPAPSVPRRQSTLPLWRNHKYPCAVWSLEMIEISTCQNQRWKYVGRFCTIFYVKGFGWRLFIQVDTTERTGD